MNSLQQLNGYGQTSITITDDRFATVIFDRMPPLQARDKEQKILTTTVSVTPGIEITDIINYSTANVRYRVEIKSKNNLLTATSLAWPTLPGYMSVGTVGLVYTVTGFRSASDWNTARAFTWTLPGDFATSYPKFWLDVKIIYFDEELGQDVEKDWAFYDLKYYEVADLQVQASLIAIPTHYKNAELDLQSAFSQFSAAGEELQLIPTNISATASINIIGTKTIIESTSATLTAAFTQTTVSSRTKSGNVALTSASTLVANQVRIVDSTVALSSAFTQTATLTDAPFEYAIQGLNSYTINELTGTGLVIDWGDGTQTSQFDAVTPTTRFRSYASSGTYTVKISGNLTSIRLGNDGADTFKILGVTRFNNNLQSFSMRHTAAQSSRTEDLFTYAPSVIPNSLTNLSYAFWQCNNFNQNISAWDTSNITNMRDMFSSLGTSPKASYNQPLNAWNTSNVTNMQNMFREQSLFNQPLNNWDTSSVTNMNNMFNSAEDFDQDISSWCVELIPTKPTGFDTATPATWITAEKPNWGAPC